MNLRCALLLLSVATGTTAQVVGTLQNVAFPGSANLGAADAEILFDPGGRWVAARGSGGAADLLFVELDARGLTTSASVLAFPSSNEVSIQNPGVVPSPLGNFLCCYGSLPSTGDLVFVSRNAGGAWVATNVLFPSGNDAPLVGTRPVVAADESFIACRGSTSQDIVIIPIVVTGGVFQPGTPFNVPLPSGNDIPLLAIDPVLTRNARSLLVPGTSTQNPVSVITIGRPVLSSNVTTTNVSFPGGNGLLAAAVPLGVSPTSRYAFVHGSSASVGDLVIIPLDPQGLPLTPINVAWPSSNNTASTQVQASVSGDGRLLAVNGSLATGDVVLLPVAPDGTPGVPQNVPFPGNNFWPNAQLAPRVSGTGHLVVQRGSSTLGDLVAMRVTFTTATTITVAAQNVLYPSNNNVPSVFTHVALAPDASFAVTLGDSNLGDLVVTPFDDLGLAQTSLNIVYPASNNVADTSITPSISSEGLLILTGGSSSSADLVVTALEIDPVSGFVRLQSSTNAAWPASNNTNPTGRAPEFSPTGQFIVAPGSPTIGDLVFAQLIRPSPHLLAPPFLGTVVPIRFASPGDPNRMFLGAATFARSPGIVLSDGRTVPARADLLFALSTFPGNPFFVNFTGTLDANGIAEGHVFIPTSPGAEGFHWYLEFVVFDPSQPAGVGTIGTPTIYRLQ